MGRYHGMQPVHNHGPAWGIDNPGINSRRGTVNYTLWE